MTGYSADKHAEVAGALPAVLGLSQRTQTDKETCRKADKKTHAALRRLRAADGGHNAVCADCSARNPGWAALPWGVMVCIDCAQLHRGLGRHISQVKSFSSGTYLWYPDEVAAMQTMGNANAAELLASPDRGAPAKPQQSEARYVKEKYVRDKYERLLWANIPSNTCTAGAAARRPQSGSPRQSRRQHATISSGSARSARPARRQARPRCNGGNTQRQPASLEHLFDDGNPSALGAAVSASHVSKLPAPRSSRPSQPTSTSSAPSKVDLIDFSSGGQTTHDKDFFALFGV